MPKKLMASALQPPKILKPLKPKVRTLKFQKRPRKGGKTY